MKIIEFGHYDTASNDAEIKNLISDVIKYAPQTISVYPHNLKVVKPLLVNHNNIKLSSIIDYPYGQSDLSTRLSCAEFCIKNGAKVLEVIAPNNYLCNRKYDKFREDINAFKTICLNNQVELRYVLEYRVFTLELMYKVAQILLENEILTIYPSTGNLLDDISDNIIATVLVNKKVPGIKIISTGNLWNDKQAQNICKNSDVYGFKCFTLNSIIKIYDHLYMPNNRPN